MGWERKNRRLIIFFRFCIVLPYIASQCNILTCAKRGSTGRVERIGNLAQARSLKAMMFCFALFCCLGMFFSLL